jgi:hypothetical protein
MPAELMKDTIELKVQTSIVFREDFSSLNMQICSGWKHQLQIFRLLKNLLVEFMRKNLMSSYLTIYPHLSTGMLKK